MGLTGLHIRAIGCSRFRKTSSHNQQHAYSHHILPVVDEARACGLCFSLNSRYVGMSGRECCGHIYGNLKHESASVGQRMRFRSSFPSSHAVLVFNRSELVQAVL